MLKLTGIGKLYKERQILKDINLEFNNVGLVFLLGNSGAGKTSLLNIIGLLDKEFSGEVIYDDKTLNLNDKKVISDYQRNHVGIIFQDYNLIDYLTVKENVVLSLELSGKKVNQSEYEQIFEKLNIQHLEQNKANELSGGEKQRVAIARAICRQNDIILADEPTGNLDKENSEIIFKTLKKLSEDHLIIVVTHDENSALKYGDLVLQLSDGEICERKDFSYSKKQKIEKKKEIPFSSKTILKRVFALTGKYMKHNVKRTIPAVIIMTICLITVGLFLGVVDSIHNISTIINKSVLENDKITITNYDPWRGYHLLSNNFLADLKKDNNVKHAIAYYEENVFLTSDSYNEEKISTQYNIIDNNDLFVDRYDDLEGRIPQNKYEIILCKSVAELLFPNGEYLNQQIKIETTSNQVFQCKVVGCRERDDALSRMMYITKEFSDEIAENIILQDYHQISFEDYDSYNGEYSVQTLNSKECKNYKILYGNDISHENEVILDIQMVNEYLGILGVEASYSQSEIHAGKIKEEDLRLIYDTGMYFTVGNQTKVKKIKIVGIADCTKEELLDITIMVSDKLIKELNHPFYNSIDIYVNSQEEKEMSSIYSLAERSGCIYASASGNVGSTIYTKLSVMLILIVILMVIVLIVTILSLHFATKLLLEKRIYEVGVQKSMGASKEFVFGIFMFHNLALGILASTIANIVMFCISYFEIIKYEGINMFMFHESSLFLVLFIGIGISALSGFFEIMKISKKSAIECIRYR